MCTSVSAVLLPMLLKGCMHAALHHHITPIYISYGAECIFYAQQQKRTYVRRNKRMCMQGKYTQPILFFHLAAHAWHNANAVLVLLCAGVHIQSQWGPR